MATFKHQMPPLTIGNRTARLPIIQGGMAVRISLAPLAGAVAKAGGIGIIAGSGLGVDELREEIRKARAIAGDGVIGVNIMVAVRIFKELVQAALDEGVDLVIAGAGFSRDVFTWCKAAGVPFVCMVGSVRVAKLAEKFGAAAVVVEGFEAGGHLGTDQLMRDLLPEVVAAVNIPVIGAGNIVTGADIEEVLALGAAGVQMGTRFGATVESSASDAMKQLWIESTETVIVKSPVGLPGRAVKNPFWERTQLGDYPSIEKCRKCLKECDQTYCIITELEMAQEGDADQGLVFAGDSVSRVDDVPSVEDLVNRLETEYDVATSTA